MMAQRVDRPIAATAEPAAAEARDLDAIHAMDRAELGEDAYPRAFFTQALSLFGAGFRVLRRDGVPAGYALTGRHAEGRDAELYALLVAPQARGSGLGALLVRDALALAQGWDRAGVWLTVAPSNTAARRLYDGLGFIETGRAADHYGPGEDRLLLRRPINETRP